MLKKAGKIAIVGLKANKLTLSNRTLKYSQLKIT